MCEKLFQYYECNNGLWLALSSNVLESLLDEAKEHEKKYEWLQAAVYYKQVSDSILNEKSILKKADYIEKEGHCYFKAAYQANSNKDFVKKMEKSIEAYQKVLKLCENVAEELMQARSIDARAKIAYASFWIETDVLKKRELIDEWWALNSELIKIYGRYEDKLALAKTYNEIIEKSTNCKYWFGMNWKEAKEIRNELISYGENAIAILTEEIEDNHELACAYCWTSWYYIMNNSIYNIAGNPEEIKKGLKYSKKALKISKKIGDKWLISWSYMSTAFAANSKNDFSSSINFLNSQIEEGRITEDHYLLGLGKVFLIMISNFYAILEEDPEEKRKLMQTCIKPALETINHFQIINLVTWNPYYGVTLAYMGLSVIAPDAKSKYNHLSNSTDYGRKAIDLTRGWRHSGVPAVLSVSIKSLYSLSTIEKDIMKKRKLLKEVLDYSETWIEILEAYPYSYYNKANSIYYKIVATADLAGITSDKTNKVTLLTDAISSIKLWLNLDKKSKEKPTREWVKALSGQGHYQFGKIFHNLFLVSGEKKHLFKAIKMYEDAIDLFHKAGLKTQVAESYWQKAIINDELRLQIEAAEDYKSASQTYIEAAKKIPQLNDFYTEYSLYMEAWNQIELARYHHSIEDYEEAQQHYEKAAEIHQLTSSWNYLSSNYLAWARVEGAEGLSRKENTQKAKQTFQKAYEKFLNVQESLKQKLKKITSSAEKEMIQRLLEASDLRRKYCQARILMEEAKLLDMKGKFLQSSQNYGKVAEKLDKIIDEVESEQEKRELQLIRVLGQAWQKMAIAQGKKSSEYFLEAAYLFEKLKDLSQTEKTSLWALGNSSFCKGLAAGLRYKTSMDLKENALAKRYIKDASSSYFEAGFYNASEYAKATLRLFDAYLYMNQAESEIDPEKKAKQYQLAENLLQIAASSFTEARQPEKTTQVHKILENVREEKALAFSLSHVMQAPSIASTTSSFAAPTPTSESSVGLEKFEHANVQANLVTSLNQVKVGESFCLSVEFINAGREPALLLRVDDFVPSDFIVVKKPEIYRIEETVLNMKGKHLPPLKLVEAKLILQPSKKGDYRLNPKVQYLDELGQIKSLQIKTLEIKVEQVIAEDRVSTGTQELDSLLFGGIPREYAVVLSGPPCDERDVIFNNFLNVGAKEEVTFCISTETTGLEDLLNKQNFFLFLCNPKPKTPVPDLPNVFMLQSKTDLTNLSIALTKALRNIDQSIINKRICIEILSDVLGKHGTNTTKEWISGLITDLGAKGFTMLAVMDPKEHPPDQATTVLNLFDGEISITQSDDPLDCKKSILVKKLRNQDYIKNPICLR